MTMTWYMPRKKLQFPHQISITLTKYNKMKSCKRIRGKTDLFSNWNASVENLWRQYRPPVQPRHFVISADDLTCFLWGKVTDLVKVCINLYNNLVVLNPSKIHPIQLFHTAT